MHLLPSDKFIAYILFMSRMDIYETERLWINEQQYELVTNFLKQVSLKIPPLKLDI